MPLVVASETGRGQKFFFSLIIYKPKKVKPCKAKKKNFKLVKWYKSCTVWILGDHPQSLKILMIDSELVLWRKGEIEFAKIEKIMKFNADNQLEPRLRW
jgi:hypothetical protein